MNTCSTSHAPRSNRCDFKRLVNTYSDSDGSRTGGGRLFQIRRPAMANVRSPKVVLGLGMPKARVQKSKII